MAYKYDRPFFALEHYSLSVTLDSHGMYSTQRLCASLVVDE